MGSETQIRLYTPEPITTECIPALKDLDDMYRWLRIIDNLKGEQIL